MQSEIDVEPFIIMDENIDEVLSLDESLERLLNNPDFQKVFIKHYLGKFVLDKTNLLTRSNVRGGVMEVLVATAYFKSFITDIHQRAIEFRLAKKEELAKKSNSTEEVDKYQPFGDTNE